MARIGLGLNLCACVLAAGAVIGAAIGVADPMILWLACLLASPFILLLLGIVAVSAIPAGRRTRCLAVSAVLLLLSVALTPWPLRITFELHRGSFDRAAAAYRVNPAAGPAPARIGVFRILAVSQHHSGNVGFQLTGSSGGGVFLVNRGPGSVWTWYNTNWVRNLGGGWLLVEED